MALDKNAISVVKDLKYGKIEIPEWGGFAHVKSTSVIEQDHLRALFSMLGEHNKKGIFVPHKTVEAEKFASEFKICTVGYALCDEDGVRLFNNEEIETILSKKAPEVIDRIFNELGNVLNPSLTKQEDSVSV